ncbi:transposase [Planctomyces sp. SH-PL62]|nr:transposase [Planctomyces sp. SH-PL62]
MSGTLPAERQRKGVALNLKFAKFPAAKPLEDFDFKAQPGLDRRLIEDLATGRFIYEGRNIVLLGPPGRARRTWRSAWGS